MPTVEIKDSIPIVQIKGKVQKARAVSGKVVPGGHDSESFRAVPRILRNNLEYRQEPKNAFRHKDKRISCTNPHVLGEKVLELARCKSNIGKIKLCSICSTFRKITLPTVADRIQQVAKTNTTQENPNHRHKSGSTKLVDKECIQKHYNPSSQLNNVHNHGCGRLRMGGDSEQPKIVGKLVGPSVQMALQPKRALGSIRNLEVPGTSIAGKNSNLANGQSDRGRLRNETRRYEVHKIVGNYKTRPSPMPAAQLQSNCSLHPGSIQWVGMADSLSRTKHLPEWHLKTRIVKQIFHLMGTPEIDLFASRRSTVVSKYVSEDAFDKRNQYTDAFSKTWQYDLGSSKLEQSFLDARNKEACHSTTVGDSRPIVQSSRSPDQSTTCESRPTQFAGLEGTGWAREVLGWKDHEVQLLQASWRASTLKTYRSAWKRWLEWASENNVKTDDPQPSDLARFLCYLHEVVKLAPRTILVYKSVVATFKNPCKSSSLSSHPVVTHALKGILSRKPTVKKPLSWKVDDLLGFLETYNFDYDSLFAVSRHTSVLLLLASGRRVHDLTLLSIQTDLFQEQDNELIFWPKFGSKTDNSTLQTIRMVP
ncbi:putative transposon Ty3-I Gag-Pol polyprotein [Operophtera brumata]|uniref:Putative transposon Ty3-I Gag-Pol polyprotein n=1 Tax=Operophtera brumata TaxID=104452 RepID=A0A0L7KZ49_OPEBR|nr:putative transposon Ty3-I Gag-Pol polyprotein [Operophtera brumata]